MAIVSHLNLKELDLLPAGEWRPEGCCWTVTRVANGRGCCLQGGLARELKIGDTVMTSPHSEATLRANQLSELRLVSFCVEPQYLKGLLTILEWRQLEQFASGGEERCFHYPANGILARRFARLAALPEPGSLGVRAALLQLWASGVAVALPAPEAFVNRNNKLETKFHRLISKISEEELAAYSLSEMAAQLGCSKQHLSRLFRVELGMSLREKHAELSLQHACQLLLNPGVKISSAANQSGYRYPTFFNALFKKRFGLTPTKWRKRNSTAPSVNIKEQTRPI